MLDAPALRTPAILQGSGLNHPAIVTVYDAGEDQGLAYIAMEYLRGTHLRRWLALFREAAEDCLGPEAAAPLTAARGPGCARR